VGKLRVVVGANRKGGDIVIKEEDEDLKILAKNFAALYGLKKNKWL